MKKITLILAMFLTVVGYSQSLPLDFETAVPFAGENGVVASQIEDPTDATNTVGQIVGSAEQWGSSAVVALDTYIDMTTANRTLTFDLYSSSEVAMTGLVKLDGEENGGWAIESQFTTSGSIGWEVITIDFDATGTNSYPNGGNPTVNFANFAQLVIFTNFGDTGVSTILVDNIAGLANGAATPAPEVESLTVAAPTPSNDAADVISVYSDAYTSIVTNSNPGWGQATVATEILVDGNNTLKYAGLTFQGMDYTTTDVSAMENLHLDYYTEDATGLEFFLIAGGEVAYNVATEDGITTGAWVSLDIPMSHFASLSLTGAAQFKTVGNGTVYVDNLYFWKAPTAAGTDTSLSDLTVDASTISGFASLSTSYSVVLPAGTTVVPTVAAATTDAGASAVVTAASSLPGDTTIAVTAADGVTTSTITVSFSIDPTPTTAAPTPSNDSADVISVYSDAFTSIVTDTAPAWGQSTVVSQIDVAGNNTLQYAGLNYQGMIYPDTDVSAMEYLHVDYYTEDATALSLVLIAGGEAGYNIATTDGISTGQWVGIDIPMSTYAALTLTAANQFKTEGNGTVWLDNLYFWKAASAAGTVTTLSDLTVDGSTIAGFGSTSISYSVELPFGTTTVPTVAATTTDSEASAVVTAAASIPGTTSIAVTASDGVSTSTITVAFTIDPTPTTAAPTPSQDEADVISVYSDAYTTIATNSNPAWGQATVVTEIQIAGNNTLEYANLNYQGFEYATADVSAMDNLHLDIYAVSFSEVLLFSLVAGGSEVAYNIGFQNDIDINDNLNQWVSIDIPMSHFASLDLTQAAQFKTEGQNTIWLDNMYFWKEASGGSLGVIDNDAEASVTVAPNPTTGLINVAGDVYNVSGQKVLTNSDDLSGLPSGIYFIKVISNGNVSTSKIIKK
jgi:hypothetical protein